MISKILVVGIRKQHATFLRKKFKGMAIDVLDDGMLHHKPVKNFQAYDKILSITRFTNRTTHDNYKAHPGYTIIPGGYSSVVAILSAMLDRA